MIDWLDYSKGSFMTMMNIEGTGLGVHIKQCSVFLESVISLCYNLEFLNLSDLCLNDQHAEVISDMFVWMKNLRVFKLAKNQFWAPGAIKIFRGVEGSNSIKYLDLSWNCINLLIAKTGDIAKALNDVLNSKSIRHLDLSYNSINNFEMSEI